MFVKPTAPRPERADQQEDHPDQPLSHHLFPLKLTNKFPPVPCKRRAIGPLYVTMPEMRTGPSQVVDGRCSDRGTTTPPGMAVAMARPPKTIRVEAVYGGDGAGSRWGDRGVCETAVDAVWVEETFDAVFVFGMGLVSPALKDRAGNLAPEGAAGSAQNLPRHV